MRKKRAYLGIFLLVVIGIALLHSGFYLLGAYNPNSSLLQKTHLSGFIIQKTDENQSGPLFSTSGILLLLEWTISIFGTVFFLLKQRIELQKDIINLYITKKNYATDKTQTDIDILYEILKDKKRLKLTAISKVFHVPTSTALEWAKTLQNGKLAEIYYPQMREPEVMLKQ